MAVVAESTALARRGSRSPFVHFLGRLFREKPLGAAGGVVFILFLLCGIFAEFLAPHGMNQITRSSA
jgi:peptide/nickel transport system permease protein